MPGYRGHAHGTVHNLDFPLKVSHVKPLLILRVYRVTLPTSINLTIQGFTMSKSTVTVASITHPLTGKAASKARKFQARMQRALSVRGNKKKFADMVGLYGLTEKMAVKLLTVCKL
jgi:hypothetical protein